MTDKQETKRQAFQRIRDIRLPKILKGITILGNLSRKNQYEYTTFEAAGLVNSLYKAVDATVKKFGVEVVDPQGETFNPEFHQAMSMQPSADVAPNTVIAVMQKGYTLSGRLLRPAMVMVSKAAE